MAFHDHLTTPAGKVVNKPDGWDPVVLKGTKPKANQDSFMYREQNGVKSILMDDDNCDCLTTLNIGHGVTQVTAPTTGLQTSLVSMPSLTHGARLLVQKLVWCCISAWNSFIKAQQQKRQGTLASTRFYLVDIGDCNKSSFICKIKIEAASSKRLS